MFQPTRYEVTGVQPVLGHEPGTFFEDDLEPGLERRLIERGSIQIVPAPAVAAQPRLDDPKPGLPRKAAESTATPDSEE